MSIADVTVFALAQLAESRDPQTSGHLERMRAYTQVLAERLAGRGPYADQIDVRFLEDLYRSSPLHDIGKVGIPDRVLLKPGPLTPEEFEIIKTHTVIGSTALRQAAEQSAFRGFLDMAAEIALRHHERFDGAGYPGGLKEFEIPLAARIVAVADEFDALSSVRVYKDAMSLEDVRRSIEEEEGKHFDPVVVGAFRDCCDEFAKILAGQRDKQVGQGLP
ncbi:MAG TPA: HD domain-containing phosphohydrolase [Thermoguttaceae bacterium]|nr:HD domain-containing phosphohydrolase [Thermoguttaceae bacterium]